MGDVLERFGPATQDWFRGAFAAPTAAQKGAWAAISAHKHALVVAPTGSGKTLSAFLWAIDRVFHDKAAAPAAVPRRGRKRATDDLDTPRAASRGSALDPAAAPPRPGSSTSLRSRPSVSTSSATCGRPWSASASRRDGSG